jgi:hypothetical protein|tara:strand:- start:1402 stop:1605 length:204 start_codon:yes stop_codon:yes gene_type:complete
MADKLTTGNKQDLKMLIDDLDNFYSYRGKNFFELIGELLGDDVRVDLEDRTYHLKEDLEARLEELKQ